MLLNQHDSLSEAVNHCSVVARRLSFILVVNLLNLLMNILIWFILYRTVWMMSMTYCAVLCELEDRPLSDRCCTGIEASDAQCTYSSPSWPRLSYDISKSDYDRLHAVTYSVQSWRWAEAEQPLTEVVYLMVFQLPISLLQSHARHMALLDDCRLFSLLCQLMQTLVLTLSLHLSFQTHFFFKLLELSTWLSAVEWPSRPTSEWVRRFLTAHQHIKAIQCHTMVKSRTKCKWN